VGETVAVGEVVGRGVTEGEADSVEVALADAVYLGSDTLNQCHAEEATMLGDWASVPFHSGSMVALQ
jgi:hypothetical protein